MGGDYFLRQKPETFNQKSIEENCFQIVKVGKETPKKQYVEPSKEDILQNFPKHIQYKTLENKGNFEGNLDFSIKKQKRKNNSLILQNIKTIFKNFISDLPEFQYLSKQNQFALAKNKYGLWLILKNLEIKSETLFSWTYPECFFVNYDFNAPNFTFLSENAIHLSGSIVKVTRLSSFPILPKYEVIKDDVEFSIPLAEVKKTVTKMVTMICLNNLLV